MSGQSYPSAPLTIGASAPSLTGSSAAESGVHIGAGAPIVIAFHEPGWDPARDARIDVYRRLLSADRDGLLAEPVRLSNDGADAEAFGVAGMCAVFVVDGHGTITWRHVTGIDPVERASAIADDRDADGDADRDADGEAAGVGSGGTGRWSRREFVATALGATLAMALEPAFRRVRAQPLAAVPEAPATTATAATAVGAAVPVTLNVNGRRLSLTLEPRVTLLDALREYAGLTGSKKGCDHGQCGACTVHVDGRRVLSCLTLAMMQQGAKITTIEGLAAASGAASGATGDALHPMQQAFIDHDGFQCGYCTSGQIMSAVAVVGEPWGPGDDDVREAMSGNICRCGAYVGIVAAVQDVRHSQGPTR